MTWSQHGPHLSPHSAVTVATPHFTRALFLPDASVTQPGLRPASVRPHPRHPPSRSRGRLMFSASRSLFLCWGLFRTARLMGSQALMGAGLTSLPYRPPPRGRPVLSLPHPTLGDVWPEMRAFRRGTSTPTPAERLRGAGRAGVGDPSLCGPCCGTTRLWAQQAPAPLPSSNPTLGAFLLRHYLPSPVLALAPRQVQVSRRRGRGRRQGRRSPRGRDPGWPFPVPGGSSPGEALRKDSPAGSPGSGRQSSQ